MEEEWPRHVPSLTPGQRSPSPDLLDGRHHLLDVILGPAPGLGPHGPAGHAGGAGAEAEPAAGPPPVRRAQARRQARAPLSLPAVPRGVGRALLRSPTPPRVPAPLPAAAPRPGQSPERPGGADVMSPGLAAGRPRPAPPPRGVWTHSAPCRPPIGRLGAAPRLDSRSQAEGCVQTTSAPGALQGWCPGVSPLRVGVPETPCAFGRVSTPARPPSCTLSNYPFSHSFNNLLTECQVRARHCI